MYNRLKKHLGISGTMTILSFVSKFKNKLTPHFKVSVLKSAIRVGGFFLLITSIPIGVFVLIIAEVVSIGEELV